MASKASLRSPLARATAAYAASRGPFTISRFFNVARMRWGTYWAKPVTSIRFRSPVGAVDEWKDARTRVTGRYPDHRALPWMQAEAALRGQPSDWHRARRCQVISKRRGYRSELGDKRVSIAGISIRGRRPPQSDM